MVPSIEVLPRLSGPQLNVGRWADLKRALHWDGVPSEIPRSRSEGARLNGLRDLERASRRCRAGPRLRARAPGELRRAKVAPCCLQWAYLCEVVSRRLFQAKGIAAHRIVATWRSRVVKSSTRVGVDGASRGWSLWESGGGGSSQRRGGSQAKSLAAVHVSVPSTRNSGRARRPSEALAGRDSERARPMAIGGGGACVAVAVAERPLYAAAGE